MNKITSSMLGLAAACLLAAPSAHALSLSSVSDHGNGVDTTFTTATQISADVSFVNQQAVALTFMLDSADVGGSALLNAILREVSGGSFDRIALSLSGGASFLPEGTVTVINGTSPAPVSFNAGATLADVALVPASNEVYVGAPLSDAGTQDWRVSFGNLAAGDQFTMTLSPVPEPASWQLAAACLLAFTTLAAAKKHRK
jgi:hypothetical protein